ncbi:RNA polymerase sigma factor [Paenibacillus crassostreae]|uniref:RNA polymerase sigma factor n=1 Tax=Paenibacillus crassostreae TaxID=1763538 RepID=UPI000A76837B
MNVVRSVKRAKKGDKEALLQLIMAEKEAYYKLAFTYMGNEHDAMDAMEDMIVRLYDKIEQLKKEESFYSWSKTILVNCCKSLLRKQKKLVLIEN